jgi:cobalt-zinc-cadmium efflux system protein
MHKHPDEHNYHHGSLPENAGRAFAIGMALNLAFVIVEFITGIRTNSLALMSDAGHNLSDVATLGLSFFAFYIARRKATSKFTYGFHKSTILASLANAVILFIAVGSIGWESVQRLTKPVETQGNIISVVAGIGIVINAVSALLFFRDKDKDINIKGAYLHLALDALVSVAVVIAGIIISYTHLKWIDPLISLLIMGVLVYSTWGLLSESLILSMDAVPKNVDLDKIRDDVKNIKGVHGIHHIHVWAISTTRNAMTAHVVLEKDLADHQRAEIKQSVKDYLVDMNVHHATLETEVEGAEEHE